MRKINLHDAIMGIVKTYLSFVCLCTLLTCPGPGAWALGSDLATRFATCTGRYSALMEHDWLMGRNGEEAENRRAFFVQLLEAVQTDSDLDGRALLHQRIDAKHAHAKLLQMSDLGSDPERAQRAFRLAELHIGQCRALLLG